MSHRENREFGVCMEKEMEQGTKMKEAVGTLEQERGKCCRVERRKGEEKNAW